MSNHAPEMWWSLKGAELVPVNRYMRPFIEVIPYNYFYVNKKEYKRVF